MYSSLAFRCALWWSLLFAPVNRLIPWGYDNSSPVSDFSDR